MTVANRNQEKGKANMHANQVTWRLAATIGFLLATIGVATAKDDTDIKDAQKDRIDERAKAEKDRIDERSKLEKDRVDERARREKAQIDQRGQAGDEQSTIGQDVSDSWITTKVKASFMGEKALKNSDINVDTEDRGMVILTGFVPNEAARARAVQIVRSIKGVRQVRDQLKTGKKL